MADPLLRTDDFPTRTRIVRDARTLAGRPVIAGTRIPAATILAYLRAGHQQSEIRADYPSLPKDGIAAVEAWARQEYGPNWKSASAVPEA